MPADDQEGSVQSCPDFDDYYLCFQFNDFEEVECNWVGECDCDGNIGDECGICGGSGAIYGESEDCCHLDVDCCGICYGDNNTCGEVWVNEDCCSAEQIGDMNADDLWNVLDVVALANCVLASNCADLSTPCAGDMNGDGTWNVLDIVQLANCVLASNCGE